MTITMRDLFKKKPARDDVVTSTLLEEQKPQPHQFHPFNGTCLHCGVAHADATDLEDCPKRPKR